MAGGHAWQGCMCGRGHAWQGVCMAGGGVHGRGVGGMRGRGVCMVGGMCGGGCVWQGACMAGGMHATHAPPQHYEIRSVNARAVRILLECILVLS